MAYGGRTRNLRIHSHKVLSTKLAKVERSVERLQAIAGARGQRVLVTGGVTAVAPGRPAYDSNSSAESITDIPVSPEATALLGAFPPTTRTRPSRSKTVVA